MSIKEFQIFFGNHEAILLTFYLTHRANILLKISDLKSIKIIFIVYFMLFFNVRNVLLCFLYTTKDTNNNKILHFSFYC